MKGAGFDGCTLFLSPLIDEPIVQALIFIHRAFFTPAVGTDVIKTKYGIVGIERAERILSIHIFQDLPDRGARRPFAIGDTLRTSVPVALLLLCDLLCIE